MIPHGTTGLEAAKRARYLRERSTRPTATIAQRAADLAEAAEWQLQAFCGGGYEAAEVDTEAAS